jgi:D-alanyl-D-alanine dipeptidase
LTLLDRSQQLVDMGSDIDAIGAVSEPNHYLEVANDAENATDRERALARHKRRSLLADAMAEAGFAQHPNEWWHFSYGDQLWAWRSGQPQAVYGRSLEG